MRDEETRRVGRGIRYKWEGRTKRQREGKSEDEREGEEEGRRREGRGEERRKEVKGGEGKEEERKRTGGKGRGAGGEQEGKGEEVCDLATAAFYPKHDTHLAAYVVVALYRSKVSDKSFKLSALKLAIAHNSVL